MLRSDQESRAIAIQLPAGEELQEHQVHERAYLLVADGEIEIAQNGQSVTGGLRVSLSLRAERASNRARPSATRASCSARALAGRRAPVGAGGVTATGNQAHMTWRR